MPHHCIVHGCHNTSDVHSELSFHSIPFKKPLLLNEWFNRIKRDTKDVSLSLVSKVCSSHFKRNDFTGIGAQRQRLLKYAVPSKFSWTEPAQGETDSSSEDEGPGVRKLTEWQEDDSEDTDTASEGDGDLLDPKDPESKVSQKTQYSVEDFEPDAEGLPCKHAFSVNHLRSKCRTLRKEQELFVHFTGFSSFERFNEIFLFVCPTMEHNDIIYWGTKESKEKILDTKEMPSGDVTVNSFEFSDDDEDDGCNFDRNYKFKVCDELLLTLMKLRTGASNTDLAERFNTDKGTISRILITWLNFLYVTLGSLNIWPHREIILKNSPKKFCEKYPNSIIIIDAIELSLQVPSSGKQKSECFSNDKRHTLKCLIGVDPIGGIMFVSQLYEGSISDKELVRRSGFLKVLEWKKQCGEIKEGDAVMADKSFTITEELKEMGLKLNVPPFLKKKGCFSADDVIRTQTIAKHRIHVERAIRKVRRFQIFHSPIPISMYGTINQIWTVVCLLSNFQNPVLAVDQDD